VTPFERDVFLVAFLSTGVSVVFLTAPSSYHRLRFRTGDKEHLVRYGSRLSVVGIVAFAVALEAVVLLVFDYVVSTGAAIAATVGFTLLVAVLWYGLPLFAKLREDSLRED
jgi:amino acid transporter